MADPEPTRMLRGARALVAAFVSAMLPGAGSCYLGRLGTAWTALGVAVGGPLLAALLWRAGAIGVWGVLLATGGALALGHGGGAAVAAIEAWRGAVKRRFSIAAGFMLGASALLVGARTASNQWLMASFAVATIAMEPTLEYGDRILVEPRSAGAAYLRGEVVIVHDPSSGERFVRRVVALAGDRVELRDAELVVNGRPLRSGVCRAAYATRCFVESSADGLRYPVADEMGEATLREQLEVPVGQVLVMRDRRDASAPIAPIPAAHLVGAVRAVWWSHNFGGARPARIGRLPVLAESGAP
ncbi:MAG: signal peptidase I [Deltaproteobacteria bacterium]|nr:signal peptidase I [Deltaproteobacteria bacterium]